MISLLFFLNILSSYKLIDIFLPLFKKIFIDTPDKRSSHLNPTPSGGGIIFVLLSILSFVLLKNYQALIILPLALVGLIDDKYKLNSITRFFVQGLTSFLLIFFSPAYEAIANNDQLIFISLIIFLITVGTTIINFSNFIDGLDGLLAGTMTIIFFAISIIINPVYLIVSGSLLGFLKWNWKPAKIFMGDTGSTFLGALLFSVMLNVNSLEKSLAILLISSPILIDPFICVIRRFSKKQKIFSAHKLHFYQRLNQAGLDHNKVSILFMFYIFLIATSYIIGNLNTAFISLVCLIIISFILEKKVAAPFDIKKR